MRRGSKGFILLGTIFIMLFLGIFMALALLGMDQQMKFIEKRRASLYAFYAAEAGIDQAINQLRTNAAWRVGFTNQQLFWRQGGPQELVGTYTLIFDPTLPVTNPNDVWVRSTGTSIGIPGSIIDGPVQRQVLARIRVENPARFFTLTMLDLRLGSGAVVGDVVNRADLLARDVVFEVNNNLPAAARTITVNGDIEYMRNLTGRNDPAVVVNGQLIQRQALTFVGVNLLRYADLAQNAGGRFEPSEFNYSGPINRATLGASNGLVYVQGDLHISGEVTESMLFVASGNIFIEDDLTCQPNQQNPSATPQIGLFAGVDSQRPTTTGNIFIPASAADSIRIEAFLIADGGIFKAEGAAYSKRQLDFTGAMAVRGRDEARSGIDLNTYSIRNYAYNPALRNNVQIPFMAYIANQLEWQEVP